MDDAVLEEALRNLEHGPSMLSVQVESPRSEANTRLRSWVSAGATAHNYRPDAKVPIRARTPSSRVTHSRTQHKTCDSPRGSELWTWQQKVLQLEEKIASLREEYARKIARTEITCEQKMRKNEEECEKWLKDKRQEMLEMKSVVNIVQAIFSKKRRKLVVELEEQKMLYEQTKRHFEGTISDLELKHDETSFNLVAESTKRRAAHELEVSDLQRVTAGLQASKDRLEEQLAESKAQIKSCQQDISRLEKENEELRQKLVESERSEELALRNNQIADLQEEIRRVRKQMLDKRNAEAEALRKELMEYVKFIVHILPEDWQSYRSTRRGSGAAERTPRPPSPLGKRHAELLAVGEAEQDMDLTTASVVLPAVGGRGESFHPMYTAPPPPVSPRRPQPNPASSLRRM